MEREKHLSPFQEVLKVAQEARARARADRENTEQVQKKKEHDEAVRDWLARCSVPETLPKAPR
jgi:hypothetical protein